MTVDVLAVGAHPDDVELGIGGLVHKLTQQDVSVAILDLTQGEMSTRGSIEERREEGQAAAQILGVAERLTAGLPDGALSNTTEQQRVVIPFVRRFRPRVLLAPMAEDRHPDHRAAHDLTRDANYFSGLARIDTGEEPYRTPRVLYYRPYYEGSTQPQLVIDISDHLEAKLESLRSHKSQFFNPEYEGTETWISSETFWDSIRTRAAYWGAQVGVAFGEPLFSEGPVGIVGLPGLEN